MGQNLADQRTYGMGMKELRKHLEALDSHLKLRNFLVGYQMTIADVFIAINLILPFQLILDQDFRKNGAPNLSRFMKIVLEMPAFVNTVGKVTFCKKGMLPLFNLNKPEEKKEQIPKQAQPQKEQPKKEEK